jgi:hypothetical protein
MGGSKYCLFLYLAHSKLPPASIGPELLVSELPADVRGTARIARNGQPIGEKPFLTGETNMSHYVRNLEHHHFKHDSFRRPGFGSAALSFADGIKARERML